MPRCQSKPKLAQGITALGAALLGAGTIFSTAAAKADTAISTIPLWDGINSIEAWGGDPILSASPTYGQTFTAPTSTSLKSFQFFTQGRGDGTTNNTQPYNAYLYQWNATTKAPIGGPIWSLTGLSMLDNGTMNSITLTANSPVLIAGRQYVFFVSTVGLPTAGRPSFNFGFINNEKAYSGGIFACSNIDTSFTTPWTCDFSDPALFGDLAFLALFGPVTIAPTTTPSTIQPYANIQSVGLDALKNQRELVLNQAGNCDQRGWVVYDSEKIKGTKPKKHQSLCVFAEGGYATGSIHGSDTIGGYNTSNASSAYGVEWKPSKQWAVGAAYGYGTANLGGFNFQDTSAYINSNINSASLYGVYRPNTNWKVAALAGYSNFNYTGSRTLLGDTANSSFSANGYTAAIQASYDIILSSNYNKKKNPINPVRIRPLLGLAWGSNQQAGFSETGAGTLLNIQGQTTNSLMGTVGTSFEAPIPLNKTKTTVLTPRIGVAYQYDFLANQDGNKSITAAFQEDTTTSFTEVGQNRGPNSIYLDLGTDLQVNPQVVLYASVNYQAFTNGNQIGYNGGVRVKF